MTPYELVNESPVSLSIAARLHPMFRHLCGKTLTRYALRGVLKDGRRVRLASVKVGGRLMTSRAALERFLEELNARPEDVQASRSPAERNKASQRAAAELDRKFAGM